MLFLSRRCTGGGTSSWRRAKRRWPVAAGRKGADPRDRRIAELEQQIEKRDQVIGEYTIANRILKKLSGQSV